LDIDDFTTAEFEAIAEAIAVAERAAKNNKATEEAATRLGFPRNIVKRKLDGSWQLAPGSYRGKKAKVVVVPNPLPRIHEDMKVAELREAVNSLEACRRQLHARYLEVDMQLAKARKLMQISSKENNLRSVVSPNGKRM
jgi:hypothetical protein